MTAYFKTGYKSDTKVSSPQSNIEKDLSQITNLEQAFQTILKHVNEMYVGSRLLSNSYSNIAAEIVRLAQYIPAFPVSKIEHDREIHKYILKYNDGIQLQISYADNHLDIKSFNEHDMTKELRDFELNNNVLKDNLSIIISALNDAYQITSQNSWDLWLDVQELRKSNEVCDMEYCDMLSIKHEEVGKWDSRYRKLHNKLLRYTELPDMDIKFTKDDYLTIISGLDEAAQCNKNKPEYQELLNKLLGTIIDKNDFDGCYLIYTRKSVVPVK